MQPQCGGYANYRAVHERIADREATIPYLGTKAVKKVRQEGEGNGNLGIAECRRATAVDIIVPAGDCSKM